MSSPKMQPPWEFLLSASRSSLQSYELSRLNYAANLRKEMGALLDQWVEENSNALLARWLLQQRERPSRAPTSLAASDASNDGRDPVSDNFLADRAAAPRGMRGPA